MKRLVRVVKLVLLVLVPGLILSGCGSSGAPAASGLATQKVTAGGVEVTAVPQRIDASGAQFQIQLDNHSMNFDFDLAKSSTLTIDGRPWTGASWSGPASGGHHSEGLLKFAAAGTPTGQARLSIGGLPGPAVFTWKLPPA